MYLWNQSIQEKEYKLKINTSKLSKMASMVLASLIFVERRWEKKLWIGSQSIISLFLKLIQWSAHIRPHQLSCSSMSFKINKIWTNLESLHTILSTFRIPYLTSIWRFMRQKIILNFQENLTRILWSKLWKNGIFKSNNGELIISDKSQDLHEVKDLWQNDKK
jgi:hypothetical protein